MVKLLATDLDDTLISAKSEISEKSVAALRTAKEKGVKLCVASGRSDLVIAYILKEYGIYDLFDYAICYNGVLLWDMKNNVKTKEKYLSPVVVAALCAALRGIDGDFMVHDEGRLLITGESPYTTDRLELAVFEKVVVKDFSQELKNPVPKFMAAGKGAAMEKAEKELQALFGGRLNIARGHENYVVAVDRGASKGALLKAVGEKEKIPPAQIMAIGDAANDLDMLRYAGISVAMGSAPKEVKGAALYVTDSCEQEGVAKALHKFIK